VRSTDRYPDNEVDKSSGDISAEIVEALQDGQEVVVDGFRRVSVFGLEVAMLDGPLRVRTLTPRVEGGRDASGT
jgi:hypothetical protein